MSYAVIRVDKSKNPRLDKDVAPLITICLNVRAKVEEVEPVGTFTTLILDCPKYVAEVVLGVRIDDPLEVRIEHMADGKPGLIITTENYSKEDGGVFETIEIEYQIRKGSV